MYINWTPMHKVIPPGNIGTVYIDHFSITDKEMRNDFRGECPPRGIYCRLRIGHKLLGCTMSDTPMEHQTNYDVVNKATDNVLIAGLGLGMILLPILSKLGVNNITVIEKNKDLIALIEPHLRQYIRNNIPGADNRLFIIYDDIFTWKPHKDSKWSTIYFDIWDNICTDNLKDITTLKRKFKRYLNKENPNALIGAWCETKLRRMKRQENREISHWAW